MRAKPRAVRVPAGAAAIALLCLAARGIAAPREQDVAVRVLPRPATVDRAAGCSLVRTGGLTVAPGVDAGARDLVDERWRALHIPPLTPARGAPDVAVRIAGGAPQSYRLAIDAHAIAIDAGDADGAFYAFATLAQLARRGPNGGVVLPCVRIGDAPVLRWRVLSDDVSRGPLPTMRYFRERIRTIAAFKMNGYSPYMEHVFADPSHPLPAPADGITPQQLRELDAYARRFHVALIPEQQTFAHMHETLRWERYARLAELPHGYLLTPADAGGNAYARDLIADELAAVPNPPFFHIGSDEPSDLGRGAAKAMVAERGVAGVFAQHVLDTIGALPAGTRPMIWDDAVQASPEMFARFPKSLVFINWHYGAEPTFVPYIRRIADAGFDQMVAPGADNWNEIYPDVDTALTGIGRFVSEGQAARVLGLFQTVWHDDGESLYEATWFPVLYAAASAWEQAPVERERFTRDFPLAFFGVDDAAYGRDVDALARARTALRAAGDESAGDYLFWADAFDSAVLGRVRAVDLAALRLSAESVIEHARRSGPPPLHANAAAVMAFAARRYDALGRAFQIATEARGYYDDARANAGGAHDDYVYRGLNVTKYLFWELRDTLLALEPLARATWEYESRANHEASMLERYHAAAQHAIARADAVNRTAAEIYARTHALPPFDDVIRTAPEPK